MDKHQFFNKLHNQLAEKYHVSDRQIMWIRTLNLFKKLSQEEIIEISQKKLLTIRLNRSDQIAIDRWRDRLLFIKKLTKNEFNDITQKTEFDK